MKYEVDGIEYLTIGEVLCCIRCEARSAREKNKKTFTVETNSFD